MIRVKWFSLGGITKRSLEILVTGMLKSPYSDDSGSGFLLGTVRPSSIEGRFLEKRQIKDEVIDPFGKTLEFNRIDFKETRFRIAIGKAELEIHNPSRSLHEFFNQLSKLSGRTISIEALSVNVLAWHERLAMAISGAIVTSLAVSNLPLSASVSAQVILTGSEDVRSVLADITGNRQFQVKELVTTWMTPSGSVRAWLHHEGKVKLSGQDDDASMSALRKTLINASAS